MKIYIFLGFMLFMSPFFSIMGQENRLGIGDIKEEAFVNLLDVDVTTASKVSEEIFDAPAIVSVITRLEIEKFGANNLLEVVERVASVYVTGSFFLPQNYISIRGDLSAEYNHHVLILINGRPSRETAFGGIDMPIFFGIPLGIVEKIEVIRGPGSVLYGTNAYSGVVNIITATKRNDKTLLQASIGSFGSRGLSAAKVRTKDDLQIQTGLNFFDQEGWDFSNIGEDIPFGADSIIPGDTLTQKMLQQNLGASIALRYKELTYNMLLTYSKQAHHGAAPFGSYPGAYTVLRNRNLVTLRLFADLGYNFKIIKDKFNITANATGNYSNNSLTTPTGLADIVTRDVLLEGTAFYHPSDKIGALLGSTIYFQNGAAQTGDDIGRGVPSYTEIWYSAYAQLTLKPFSNFDLKVILGVQLNKPANISLDFVPRAGIIIRPSKKVGYKFLYGEAFRAPFQGEQTIRDLPVIIGSNDLKPETVSTFEAQIFYYSPKIQLEGGFFHSTQRDIISRTTVILNDIVGFPPQLAVSSFQNNNRLILSGFEFEGKYAISDNLFLTGAATYQMNTLNDSIKGSTLVPNTLLKVGIFYTSNKYGLNLSIFDSYFSQPGKADEADKRNPEATAYNFITAKISIDIIKLFKIKRNSSIDIGFYGVNLLNENIRYPEYVRRNINTIPGRGGRSIYFNISYKF